jgi:hypothetical protein
MPPRRRATEASEAGAQAWRPGRTSAGERRFHHLGTLLTGLTGLALFAFKDLTTPDPEAFSVVSHPWQPHAQHLHVLAAPLMLVSLGLLLREHVLGRLANPERRRSRRTGWLLTLAFGPMALSGYLLQVTVEPAWRTAWKWTHLGTGGLFLSAYAGHLLLARLRARRGGRPEPKR